jgi:hypothetical protein
MRQLLFFLAASAAIFGYLLVCAATGVWSEIALPWGVRFLLLLWPAALTGGLELIRRVLPGGPVAPRFAAAEAAVAVLCILSPAPLHAFEPVLAFLLTAVLGMRLLAAPTADRHAAALAVGLAFAVEAALVHAGQYVYADAVAAPLPLWLPGLWGNVGIAARRLFAVGAGGEPAHPAATP